MWQYRTAPATWLKMRRASVSSIRPVRVHNTHPRQCHPRTHPRHPDHHISRNNIATQGRQGNIDPLTYHQVPRAACCAGPRHQQTPSREKCIHRFGAPGQQETARKQSHAACTIVQTVLMHGDPPSQGPQRPARAAYREEADDVFVVEARQDEELPRHALREADIGDPALRNNFNRNLNSAMTSTWDVLAVTLCGTNRGRARRSVPPSKQLQFLVTRRMVRHDASCLCHTP